MMEVILGPPLSNLSGNAAQFQQVSQEPTGKGRGGASAGLPDVLRSTGDGRDGARTDGRMPPVEGKRSMGPVGQSQGIDGASDPDGLQRALEGEVVGFLRRQNSQLMEDVAFLKGKLELMSASKADSGLETSPWSTVQGTNSSGKSSAVGISSHERPGRHGSRTPRSKVRDVAVSPEKRKNDLRFTPNGTQVPPGPPPSLMDEVPPVPPFPGGDVAGVAQLDGQDLGTSFVSNLYDTCESKAKVKNGDVEWKPQIERHAETDVLSASEAKQIWLEREVQSLKTALDRVSVPMAFQQSPFGNAGTEKGDSSVPVRSSAVRDAIEHQARALHGGSGNGQLPDRAAAWPPNVPTGVRDAYLHGDLYPQDRASNLHGDVFPQGRASNLHGDVFQQGRASNLHGDVFQQGRASNLHGDVCQQDRVLPLHGDLFPQDRASHVHGDLPPHARALNGMGGPASAGLHEWGPVRSGPRGAVEMDLTPGRFTGPWGENGGSMNTKGELPELPQDSSPLQFGDWLHLITPTMKDISAAAGWWWETTLRQAKAHYEDWRRSSPLQRIQINPQLPSELQEAQFQRTEQRGIQMLLRSIPSAEQQALVTDRVLSSTAIIYKLLIRFQPGGPGEKQLLLNQLTNFPKCKDIHEVAAGLRNWRRHFGRAREVEVSLPDGVLLLKTLDAPLQHLGSADAQAAFRLSQSRMHLELDQQPTHHNLWVFSQCLLAEAETLCLTSTTSTTSAAPIKIKQLEADVKISGKQGNGAGKSLMTPL